LEQDIEEIYKQYSKIIYYYILGICHNEFLAEEIAQDTFCIAVEKIREFRNECKIKVWLCQIAKNLLYKETEKIKKIVNNSFNEEIGEIIDRYNMEEDFIEKEKVTKIYKQIEELESPRKELMYLRLKLELPFKELGEILGQSETWARVEFYRWKQKVKVEMEDK
jgi:RNA polymerase sigma factor (sigma-70 family)